MASCIISVARDTACPILMTRLCCPGIPSSALQLRNVTGVTGRSQPGARTSGMRWIAKMTEGQGRDMTTFASSCIRCSDQPARSGNRHLGGITAHVSVMYVQYVDRHVMCLPFVSRHCDPWVSQKSLKTPRLCKQSCTDFRARIAKNRANPMRSRSLDLLASVFEELRKPQQRLLRLVDGQIFHSLQQVRRDVLVEELPCRASVSDRLFRFDCHGRWRNRAWSRCACSGRRCGCYCDWRRRCGVLSPGRCVFGRLSWRHSVCESRLYCAESGLKVLLAAVSRREPWYLYLRCRLLLHLNIRIDRRIAV
jgi:hypothetical protein